VRVRGDLIIDGDTTTVNTANLSVEDTFIELARNNSDTLLDAGLYVNRGTAGNNALFYWDESEDNFIVGTTTNDAGTSPITNITLANIKVATTPTDNNHAASKSYVDSTVVAAAGMTNFDIVGDDSTGVTVGDNDTVKVTGGANIDVVVTESDTITVSLEQNLNNINSISNGSTNGDLLLTASGTGSVVVNNILTFASTASDPAGTPTYTKIYHKTIGGGDTGIYFKNPSGTVGELISKKKATALAIALG